MDENQALATFCKAMSVCPIHRKFVMADIQTMVLPPIRLKQFLFFQGEGQYGAITWAFLDDTAANKHIENRVPLSVEERTSGDQIWITSLIGYNIKPRKLLPVLLEKLPFDQARYLRGRSYSKTIKKVISLTRTPKGIRVNTTILRTN